MSLEYYIVLYLSPVASAFLFTSTAVVRAHVSFQKISIVYCFSNQYVKKYVGESKIDEALKYGENGKDCSIYYSKDVCPWDTSAMIKIASKVMTSGNIDFASIASAAAASFVNN